MDGADVRYIIDWDSPYDGELSVDFPRANTRARGGVLADAMGEPQKASCSSTSMLTARVTRNGKDLHARVPHTHESARGHAGTR
jgi:hypothetical protein